MKKFSILNFCFWKTNEFSLFGNRMQVMILEQYGIQWLSGGGETNQVEVPEDGRMK